MLRIDPRTAIPIWKQIEDEVRRLVAMGTLPEGAVVPSVRELAQELRVNPATVSKAYQKLTDAGLLTTRRGEGTFVAEKPAPVNRSDRRQTLASEATRYASIALTIGADEDAAVEAVRAAFTKLSESSRRSR